MRLANPRTAAAALRWTGGGLLAGLLVASLSCGSSTTPTGTPTPVPTVAPTATPVPVPTPDPLPAGMTCNPTPPPMLRMQVKLHSDEGGHVVLDSQPLVPNTDHYCERVGFGNWKFCATRPEGNSQRPACDYMATGKSPATHRWGPTWYYDDTLCSETTRCADHPTNQFMAIARNSGTFKACAAPTVPVAADGTRCGTIEIQ